MLAHRTQTRRYIHDPAKAGKAHKNGKARAGRSINYHSICLCQYYQFVAVVEQHRKEPLQLAPATQEKKRFRLFLLQN